MDSAICVDKVSKAYGAVRALEQVSFSVERGEMFGLIGPDGSGKSSLYQILATLSLPDSGSASILGLDTVKDYKTLRTKIGYMPDRFSLYPDLSVMENLEFFASLFGVTVKDNFELIAPIFGQLSKFPKRRAGALSGGMKQKLALSCALIHRPEILLLDEPTTGVDAVSRSEFWDMLDELKRLGITILVSTSYMDEAARCERIAIMDSGRILRIGTESELTASLHENLYNAISTNMFGLLNGLRKLPEVENCYTFGATIHVVGSADFKPKEVENKLREMGISDAKIYPAKGDIEDLFIKIKNEQ